MWPCNNKSISSSPTTTLHLLDSHQLFCHSYGKLWCSRKLHAYWLWLLLETNHHLQSNVFNLMLSLNENSTWDGKGRPNGRPNNMMTLRMTLLYVGVLCIIMVYMTLRINSLEYWSFMCHHRLAPSPSWHKSKELENAKCTNKSNKWVWHRESSLAKGGNFPCIQVS
jgi:hypothetical protein